MPVSQPVLMNSAVNSPQAMNAPMLGMTMFDSAVPNFWTRTRRPPRCDPSVGGAPGGSVVCAMEFLRS